MSEVKIKCTCPLGHICEQIKDGYIERCMWYIKMRGVHPQTGEPIEEFNCSINWQVLLGTELNGNIIGTNAAVNSLRNETVKRQEDAIRVINEQKAIADK